ncbi:hypothetical protein HWV62_15617 [Athelia sp. TMB]|nr:hypothetical protein HWV62_15617 [Athelia sp. TMB]
MPTDVALAAMRAARDARFVRGEPEQERHQEDGLGLEALWEFDENMNAAYLIVLGLRAMVIVVHPAAAFSSASCTVPRSAYPARSSSRGAAARAGRRRHARDHDALLLAAAREEPALANGCVVPERHVPDEPVRVRLHARFLDQRELHLRARVFMDGPDEPVRDIRADDGGEDRRLLGHQRGSRTLALGAKRGEGGWARAAGGDELGRVCGVPDGIQDICEAVSTALDWEARLAALGRAASVLPGRPPLLIVMPLLRGGWFWHSSCARSSRRSARAPSSGWVSSCRRLEAHGLLRVHERLRFMKLSTLRIVHPSVQRFRRRLRTAGGKGQGGGLLVERQIVPGRDSLLKLPPHTRGNNASTRSLQYFQIEVTACPLGGPTPWDPLWAGGSLITPKPIGVVLREAAQTRSGRRFSAWECVCDAGVSFGSLLVRAIATERRQERKEALLPQQTAERARSVTPSENGGDVDFPFADDNSSVAPCVVSNVSPIASEGLTLESSGTPSVFQHCATATPPLAPPHSSASAQPTKRPASSKVVLRQKARGKLCKATSHVAAQENRIGAPRVSKSTARHVVSSAMAVRTAFKLRQMWVTRSAWLGLKDLTKACKKVYLLEDLCGPKSKHWMKLLRWNTQETIVLHGEDGRIFAILGGQPRGRDWAKVVATMAEAIEAKRSQLSTSQGDDVHRRSTFTAILKGIIHGNGTTLIGEYSFASYILNTYI